MSDVNETADQNPPIQAEAVRQLATLLNETGLSEIEYEASGLRIRVAKGGVMVNSTVAAAPVAVAAVGPTVASTPVIPAGDHPGTVKSPMVGVAYLSAEPTSPPFVQVGQSITEGQTILLIEAMKTFNPVRAPRSGTLIALLVSDTQPVEFGEPLAIIE